MPRSHKKRGQVALEYIATASWALIAMLVMLGIMFYLGIFQPKITTENSCIAPSGFNTHACVMNTSGYYAFDLEQSTDHVINVTAIRCTTEREPTLNATDALAVPIQIRSGRHAYITNGSQRCYANISGTLSPITGSEGNAYKGKIFIKYTEADTLMQHIIFVDATMKYETAAVNYT